MSATSTKMYSRFKYTEEQLKLAVEAVQSGSLSQNQASKKYNIPKGTLNAKVRNKVPMERKMGPDPVLSRAEEDKFSSWIIGKAKLGFPMHHEEVLDAVEKLIKVTGRTNPFTDNRPGKKWMRLFLKRRPEISKRNTEIISKARAAVTETAIREWFTELFNYLSENNLLDISPDRIFNADETGMKFCPKSGKLLGPKKYKDFYEISSEPEKECITVLCNFSAAGVSVPPMIVVPYKRIPRDVQESIPDSYFIGRSDSGWMVSETFYEYVCNCFYPWLVENKFQFPVVLFLDGHKSHINAQLYEFCGEKGILLYCLLPNAPHVLQPCDVALFKPLKASWRKEVLRHKQETSKYITKISFSTLFEKAYKGAISSDTIKNGFRACGLFPLNADAVDYNKCISVRRQDIFKQYNEHSLDNPSILEDSIEATVATLEIYINENNITTDEAAEEYPGDDDSLIKFWKYCQKILVGRANKLKDIKVNIAEMNAQNENATSYSATNDVLTDSFLQQLPLEFDDFSYFPEPEDVVTNTTSNEEEQENEKINEEESVNLNETASNQKKEASATKTIIVPDGKPKTDKKIIIISSVILNPKRTEVKISKDNYDIIENNLIAAGTSTIEEQLSKPTVNEENKVNEEKVPKSNANRSTDERMITDTVQSEIIDESKSIISNKSESSSPNIAQTPSSDIWGSILHWPGDTKSSKGKTVKEKVPFALVSSKWKEIHLKKENEKQQKIKDVEKKKHERLEKKIKLEETKQNKKKEKLLKTEKHQTKDQKQNEISNLNGESSISSVTNSSTPKLQTQERLKEGDYVLVMYDKIIYPGLITDVASDTNDFEVSTMISDSHNEKRWKWPKKKDQIWYNKDAILKQIERPAAVGNSSGIFEIPEMDNYYL